MTTTTTGDLETIRRLDQAVKRHSGDTTAWERLGGQFAARRTQIGYPHSKREQFVRDRCRPHDGGLSSKIAYEMEHGISGPRKTWPSVRLITAAAAYQVTIESIIAVLDDDDQVLQAAGLAGLVDPAPVVPAAALNAGLSEHMQRQLDEGLRVARLSGVLSDEALRDAVPHVIDILIDLGNLKVSGIVRPSGWQLFPDAEEEARLWDKYADVMPDGDLALLVASQRVLTSAALRPDKSVG